ncbi:hypothetical protein QJS10_CPA06g00298 [Acorus calamus]|uniref:Uncharacterized protein n=1 Tax=Acorus calamus TaxID=4465 RepID=A0AAV9ELQ6_ACOCL|nr:hypothetical protein QJS10_CPA06g00298 [Acorus calamus]
MTIQNPWSSGDLDKRAVQESVSGGFFKKKPTVDAHGQETATEHGRRSFAPGEVADPDEWDSRGLAVVGRLDPWKSCNCGVFGGDGK